MTDQLHRQRSEPVPAAQAATKSTLLQRRYEAVEPIDGWEDLRLRLYPNRRVHACFHPTMPAEPLVILHAALRDRVAGTVAEILDENQRCARMGYARLDAPPLYGLVMRTVLPHHTRLAAPSHVACCSPGKQLPLQTA